MSEDTIRDADHGEPVSSHAEQESRQSPGAVLAAQRQALGWSVEDVAAKLKLAPRQIAHIEADNYGALPGISIVTGFIRAYAKVLQLDPAPLIAQLPREESMVSRVLPIKQELATPFSEARLRANGKTAAPSTRSVILLAALVIAAGVFAAQQMGYLGKLYGRSDVQKPVAGDAAATDEAGRTDTSTVSTKLEPVVQAPAPDSSLATAPVADSGKASAAPTSVAAPSPVSVAAPAQVASAPQQTSEAKAVAADQETAESNLVLQMNEDSWVEVKRAGGGVILGRIVKAGETETVAVKEPVTLTIGNVHGVQASFRGAPLELKAGKANTARLQLK